LQTKDRKVSAVKSDDENPIFFLDSQFASNRLFTTQRQETNNSYQQKEIGKKDERVHEKFNDLSPIHRSDFHFEYLLTLDNNKDASLLDAMQQRKEQYLKEYASGCAEVRDFKMNGLVA
jgi:2-oxo-4-hydroxy-4-carboxy--5-ureidoimidazoline (OHCU) decarboxylase